MQADSVPGACICICALAPRRLVWWAAAAQSRVRVVRMLLARLMLLVRIWTGAAPLGQAGPDCPCDGGTFDRNLVDRHEVPATMLRSALGREEGGPMQLEVGLFVKDAFLRRNVGRRLVDRGFSVCDTGSPQAFLLGHRVTSPARGSSSTCLRP